MSHFTVEHNGQCYVVLKDGAEIAAFYDCASAYEAKRDFEQKNLPLNWQKMPPAMRWAKLAIYGELAHS